MTEDHIWQTCLKNIKIIFFFLTKNDFVKRSLMENRLNLSTWAGLPSPCPKTTTKI